jgi:hypothetical protein
MPSGCNSKPYEKDALAFVSPGHSLDDFGRSNIYIIHHNPSWKENQWQKRESFWIGELQTLHPDLKNCHVTISYRDVKIIIVNIILYIIKIYMYTNYKEYENNEKNVMMKSTN